MIFQFYLEIAVVFFVLLMITAMIIGNTDYSIAYRIKAAAILASAWPAVVVVTIGLLFYLIYFIIFNGKAKR